MVPAPEPLNKVLLALQDAEASRHRGVKDIVHTCEKNRKTGDSHLPAGKLALLPTQRAAEPL